MILNGSQRGHAAELAVHLTHGHTNEHVEIHRIDGFAGQTVYEALTEIELISKGTRCQQPLFSVNFNPPDTAKVPTTLFEEAVKRVARQFGLENQPHVMVFHEKKGRRHCHCVWSRIDADRMRAINLPYFKNRLTEIGKALFLEQGWELPQGFIDRAKANPLNFDLQDWHQAKHQKRCPKEIKQILQKCWNDTTNKAAFEKEIEGHGFYLACGHPRRGFVVVDWSGKVRSLSRQTGVKAKDLAEKLGPAEDLQDVVQVQSILNQKLIARLKHLSETLHHQQQNRLVPFEQRKKDLTSAHIKARQELRAHQHKRLVEQAQVHKNRLSKGLWRVWDRLTGKHQKTLQLNTQEEQHLRLNNQAELDTLRFDQLAQRRVLQQSIDDLTQQFAEDRQRLVAGVISQAEKSQRPELEQALAQSFQSLL